MIPRNSYRSPRRRTTLRLALAALIFTIPPSLAVAQDVRLDLGYNALSTQWGASLPTGAGVAVTQVEASIIAEIDDPNDADPNKVIQRFQWMPSVTTTGTGDFSGVNFTFRSPPPPATAVTSPKVVTGTESAFSSHAFTVGGNFYGNANSFTPGIVNVDSYEADDWLGSGILEGGQLGVLPNPTQNLSRVANHSYAGKILYTSGPFVGTTNVSATLDLLKRIDFLVERDDMINVVGMQNGSNGTQVATIGTLIGSNTDTIMSYAANTISVGRSNLGHWNGTPTSLGQDPVYGRNGDDTTSLNYREHPRPDLVAPAAATSYATPLVSSAAAFLIDASRAHAPLSVNPLSADPWSTTSYVSPRIPSQTIYAADTSEVIRAALMAGADRKFFNSDGVKALDYRGNTAFYAPNGLDRRYGAGQLNVRNAFDVLAGKQHAVIDQSNPDGMDTANPIIGVATVPVTGFDYDQSFGGENSSNSIARYNFTGSWTGQTFTASLVWNVGIDTDNDDFYIPSPALFNLNLRLWDITGTRTLVASSLSDYENTENIFTTLTAGNLYQLEVTRPNTDVFEWDYGIAWNGSSNQVWRGTSSTWNVNGATNWQRGNNLTTTFLDNDQVVFTDLGTNKSVNITAPVAPDFVTVNSTADYSFNGSAITGPGGLFKQGTGTLFLNNANTYTGGTFISAGRLVVNGSVAGPVDVQSAGTLGGNGTINGNVTGAGKVAPGNSIGTLHITGAYNITGTNDFEISKVGSLLTNDLVDQITAMTYGGILKISLATGSDAAATFTPGSSWDLFNFTNSYSGQFTNNNDFGVFGGGGNLPALTATSYWSFDYASGTLSVIPEPSTWAALLGVGILALRMRRKKTSAT